MKLNRMTKYVHTAVNSLLLYAALTVEKQAAQKNLPMAALRVDMQFTEQDQDWDYAQEIRMEI